MIFRIIAQKLWLLNLEVCKQLPGGTGTDGMKGSLRGSKAWHCERPREVIGKGWSFSGNRSSRTEELMERSWDLEPPSMIIVPKESPGEAVADAKVKL